MKAVDEAIIKQKLILERKLATGDYASPSNKMALAIEYNDFELFNDCFKEQSASNLEGLIITACEFGCLEL